MTLTIQTDENEQRELKLTIEVPEKRVEQAMKQTARKLSREIHVPGFRKGKVPYSVIVRRVGKELLRVEAIEGIVQTVFEEAMEEVAPEMYGRSSFDDMEADPLVLKFTIPLVPQVDLGDYRELRKEIEPITITDEAIDESLEQVQLRHQQIESVDRPAAIGDLVTISGKGELIRVEDTEEEAADSEDADVDTNGDDEDYEDIIFNEENIDLLLDGEKLYLGPEFVAEVVSMSAGDEKAFSLTFSDDFKEKELAGKEADFEISVLDVKERELPPLDDELAKLDGDHETLDDLKENLRQGLEEKAQAAAKNELIEGMIDDVLENAVIVYPPAAVEMEIDNMVANFKEQVTRSGWEWEDFLKLQSNSEEAIRENFVDSAKERLERQQVLRQFVLNEKLTVEADDVDSNIEKRLESYSDNDEFKESMRNYFSSDYGFDMISSEIIMDKVHERMAAILTGEAPNLELLEVVEALVEETNGEEE